MVFAKNNIMPVEIANPDKILVEGMKTKFYIIINNKDIQENLVQLEITFFNEDEQKITIPYNGENIIEVPFTIPLLINQINMPVSVNWLYKNKFSIKGVARYFLLQTSFNVYKKYPSSVFPNLIADKYNSLVIGKDYVYKLWSNQRFQVSISPDDNPTSSYMFEWRWTYKKLKDYNDEVASMKKAVEDSISQTRYKSTYNIINQQTSSSDPNIETINYAIGCNYEKYSNSDIYYKCVSEIIVKVKTRSYFKNTENNIREYFFYSNFNSRWSPKKAKNDRSKYMSELEKFAKNITLVDLKNTKYKEFLPSFYPGIDLKRLKIQTNYKALAHSQTYNKIMNGDKPKIEKPKKDVNVAGREFEIKLRPWLKDTIRNTGIINAPIDYATVWIIVDISGKAFDKDNKEIKDIKDSDLFADSNLVCSMISKNSQLWFKNGAEIVKTELSKITENRWACDIISKWLAFYKWPYKNLEYVDVYIIDKNKKVISNKIRYKIKVIDATPNIELEKREQSIQDTADSVFKFKIKDEFHKDLKCKVSFPYDAYFKNHMPTIKISNKGRSEWSYIVEFDCQEGKEIPIRVSPPKLSNFDVLGELNSLSMVDLQKDTAISLAWDLVWYGVEERLKNLAQTKKNLSFIHSKKMVQGSKIMGKIDNYEKTLRTLNQANDMAGKAQDAIKVAQTKKTLTHL